MNPTQRQAYFAFWMSIAFPLALFVYIVLTVFGPFENPGWSLRFWPHALLFLLMALGPCALLMAAFAPAGSPRAVIRYAILFGAIDSIFLGIGVFVTITGSR